MTIYNVTQTASKAGKVAARMPSEPLGMLIRGGFHGIHNGMQTHIGRQKSCQTAPNAPLTVPMRKRSN